MARLVALSNEFTRYSEGLGQRFSKEFLAPFRGLLEEFDLKRTQLRLARDSFRATFSSGLDSNLYLSYEEAKAVNEDPHKLPEKVASVKGRLEEAELAFASLKAGLVDLSKKLDNFLVETSLNNFQLRQLDYALLLSEREIKKMNERLDALNKMR